MDKVAAFCMDEDSITALILAVLALSPAGFWDNLCKTMLYL